MRETFHLSDIVGLGNIPEWHDGMATGIVLPLRAYLNERDVECEPVYRIDPSRREGEYRPAVDGDVLVPPEVRSPEKADCFLISIDPAPGIQAAFNQAPVAVYKGLLAHELAECLALYRKNELSGVIENMSETASKSGTDETIPDLLAGWYGFRRETEAHLEFLAEHADVMRNRTRPQSAQDDMLAMLVFLGATVQRYDEPEEWTPEETRKHIERRLAAVRDFPYPPLSSIHDDRGELGNEEGSGIRVIRSYIL